MSQVSGRFAGAAALVQVFGKPLEPFQEMRTLLLVAHLFRPATQRDHKSIATPPINCETRESGMMPRKTSRPIAS